MNFKGDLRSMVNTYGTLGSLTEDHLGENEREIVQRVKGRIEEWLEMFKNGENPSFVIVSGAYNDLADRTGYGCGKTHLMRVMFVMTGEYHYENRVMEGAVFSGWFLTAKQALTYVAADGWLDSSFDKRLRIVFIDDVGREGVIPYVSMDHQEAERHHRYYTVINTCYELGLGVVMTSNMRLKALASYIGGASWSRLVDMTPPGFMQDMTGLPDYRVVSRRS